MAGGQSFTASAGNLGRAVTIALVGAVISASAGTLTPNTSGDVPLTGQAATFSQTAPTPDYSRALTGSEITASAGTITLNLRPTDITGQAITTAAGVVTAEGSSVTVNISGVEATFGQGEVDGGSQFPTGSVIASAQGTCAVDLSFPLTGQEMTSGSGTISPAQEADDTYIQSSQGTAAPASSIALTGVEMTTAAGDVGVTGDVTLELTGESVTTEAGTIGIDEAFGLSGVSATFAQQNMGAPGGATLTGVEIVSTAGDVFTTNDRTFALTGQEITSAAGTTFASPLAFVTGQELTVSAQEIGPRVVALIGVEISASQGRVLPPEVVIDTGGGWPTHHKKRKKKRHHDEEMPAEEAVVLAPEISQAKESVAKAEINVEKVLEELKAITAQPDAKADEVAEAEEKVRLAKLRREEEERALLLLLVSM